MDNEKEISFGAYDSELMRQEIYIPEGFEATIDGDKIILKKIESEDEKVRKALVELVKCNERSGYTLLNNVSTSSMLDWLEKQGEQKPIDKIQLGKKYKCIASPRYSTFRRGNIYKPVDNFLCNLMNLCYECFEPIEDSEQKPTDEDMKEALRTEYEKGRADAIAQMQKGWSDKEKIMYADIIEATKKSGVFKEAYKRELVDWLKSLKDRYTWKPSYKQIDVLKIAADGCADQTVSQILSTLYKDLKKLKGE